MSRATAPDRGNAADTLAATSAAARVRHDVGGRPADTIGVALVLP